MRRADLKDQKFGEWLVLEYSHTNKTGVAHWVCKCSCGSIAHVSSGNLTSGLSTNCGCKRIKTLQEKNKTHGMSKTRVYKIWAGMIQRCTNPNRQAYKHYGSRGISVCERWMTFENFFKDMGHPTSDAHTLERKNNELGYSPDNCEWATMLVQSRNSRNCKLKIEQVVLIRSKINSGESIASVSRNFCVSESLIRAIKNNEVWNESTST